MWTQLISYSYEKYTEKEKKLRDHVFAVDYVGVPLFCFLYVNIFGALSGNRQFETTENAFEICNYLCMGLSVLVMYQHMRVSPCPLEDNVEMSGVMSRIGKWIFLTRHVLALQAIHFALSFLSTHVEGFGWLIGTTHTASVFIAALGIFVTIQYFTLVSPDKDFSAECLLWKQRGCHFRMIQDCVHIPAGFIAVLDLLFVKDILVLRETAVPMNEMLLYFFVFVVYYTSLVHINFYVTKQWPYGMLKKLGHSPIKWAKFTFVQFFVLSIFLAISKSIVSYRLSGSLWYNAVNGVPTCASSFLLHDVLRGDWGFDGYVTSDSGAVKDIFESHHYTSNWNDTVKAAIEAGCDMESASWPKDHPWSTGGPYIKYIPGVVRSGLMNESKLDDALRHTLDLRFRLGLFDPVENQPFWNDISEKDIRSDEHQSRAVDATEQSFVLLRNEKNTLPFRAGKRVLVTGPHADDRGAILGNYIGEICADSSYNCVKSPFEAIQAMNNASNGTTTLEPGCESVLSTNTSGFQAALDAAKRSDLVIFVGGLDTTVERESLDRHNVTLPGVQANLLSDLLELEIPVAVILYHGGIVTFDSDLLSKIPALISAGYPGFYGADAMANLLFDEENRLATNRFGKTSVTWYSDEGWKDANFDMLDFSMTTSPGRTYRYYTGKPEFPFGFGLGYAETSMSIEHVQSNGNGGLTFSIQVENTHETRSTDEVITLFATARKGVIDFGDPASHVQTSLIAFERVGPIAPQDSAVAELNVDPQNVELTDSEGHSKLYSGKYDIFLSVDGDSPVFCMECDGAGGCGICK